MLRIGRSLTGGIAGMAKMETIIGTVLCLGFTVPGIVLTGIGYNQLQHERRSLAWPTTSGVITASEILENKQYRNSNTRSDVVIYFEPSIRYRYTVSGRSYLSNQVSFGGFNSTDPKEATAIVNRYEKGRSVTVYYNPTRPEESVLETGTTPLTYIPLGLGIIFLGIGILMLGLTVFVFSRIPKELDVFPRQEISDFDRAFLDDEES